MLQTKLAKKKKVVLSDKTASKIHTQKGKNHKSEGANQDRRHIVSCV